MTKPLSHYPLDERPEISGMWCDTPLGPGAMSIVDGIDGRGLNMEVVTFLRGRPKVEWVRDSDVVPHPDLPRAWGPDGTPLQGSNECQWYGERISMSMRRCKVYKENNIFWDDRDGLCEGDRWVVTASPIGIPSGIFATHAEAMDYADKLARTVEVTLPRPEPGAERDKFVAYHCKNLAEQLLRRALAP